SRTVAMVSRYRGGLVPAPSTYTDADLEVQRVVSSAAADADAAMERFAPHEAIDAIWRVVDDLNGYITEQEPWVLAKSPETAERLATVLYTVTGGLRALAVLLARLMPVSTEKLWRAIGGEALGELGVQPIRDAGRWGQLSPGVAVSSLEALFPRIESE